MHPYLQGQLYSIDMYVMPATKQHSRQDQHYTLSGWQIQGDMAIISQGTYQKTGNMAIPAGLVVTTWMRTT